jgi:hypothetical protein
VATLVVMGVLTVQGGPLKTEEAPLGIVSYELARDVPGAREILDSWAPRARVHAGFNLGLDFLFLALYSTTIGLACVGVARSLYPRHRTLASAGWPLAWAQWLAALLDIVENTALLAMLVDAPAAPWPAVAWWCAVPKFAIVFLGLAYAGVGAAVARFGSR